MVAMTGLIAGVVNMGTYPLTVQLLGQPEKSDNAAREASGLAMGTMLVTALFLGTPALLLANYLLPGAQFAGLAMVLTTGLLLNSVHTAVASCALAADHELRAASYEVSRAFGLSPLLLIGVIDKPADFLSASALYGTGALASAIAMIAIHRIHVGWMLPSLASIADRSKVGWKYSAGTFAESVNSTSDQLMFERLGRVNELGFYAIAVRVFSFVLLIPGAALDRNIAGQLDLNWHNRSRHRRHLRRRVTKQTAVGCLFASVGLAAVSHYSGLGEAEAVVSTSLLLSLSLVIGIQWRILGWAVVADGGAGYRSAAVLSGALVNVPLNLVAIPNWGAPGAALTTVVSESIIAFVLAWRLRRQHRSD